MDHKGVDNFYYCLTALGHKESGSLVAIWYLFPQGVSDEGYQMMENHYLLEECSACLLVVPQFQLQEYLHKILLANAEMYSHQILP